MIGADDANAADVDISAVSLMIQERPLRTLHLISHRLTR